MIYKDAIAKTLSGNTVNSIITLGKEVDAVLIPSNKTLRFYHDLTDNNNYTQVGTSLGEVRIYQGRFKRVGHIGSKASITSNIHLLIGDDY